MSLILVEQPKKVDFVDNVLINQIRKLFYIMNELLLIDPIKRVVVFGCN